MKTWRRKALMERRFVRWIFGIARSSSILAEVDRGSGVLEEAQMLGSKAAEVGFDWEYAVDALSKVREEVEEVQELLSSTETVDRGELAAEIGDLLFAVVNVSRKLELDAGAALGMTNQKFRRRFAYVEEQMRQQGRGLDEAPLAELEALWQEAKEKS